MQVLDSMEFSERPRNPVLTIGNFDGIHIAHKKIIDTLKKLANDMSGETILMTFNPHPLIVLKPHEKTRIITPLPLKIKLLGQEGIDFLMILPFSENIRFIEPEAFVKMLVDKIGIKGLVIGDDFRFGKERRGDLKMLDVLSNTYNFRLVIVNKVEIEGERVGSQTIRRLLVEGNVKKAGLFLGRPYEIHGRIVKGRGRNIGFRTANIETDFDIIPKEGVYITKMEFEGRLFLSVTNIGKNPTFNQDELSIETHLLDFSGDIYGKETRLLFLERLRDEITFPDIDSLKSQIEKDVEKARKFFETGSL